MKEVTKDKTNGKMNSKLNGKAASAPFKTRNDMDSDTRKHVIALLNEHLACTFDLMSQTKQAHWNVKGKHFIGLHELFDDFAEGLEDYVDKVAERVTALGGIAMGTARMAAQSSQLEEYPTDITDGMAHVKALSERYSALGAMIRAGIDQAGELDDKDTADLFTELSRDLDKWLWFLEAHLQD